MGKNKKGKKSGKSSSSYPTPAYGGSSYGYEKVPSSYSSQGGKKGKKDKNKKKRPWWLRLLCYGGKKAYKSDKVRNGVKRAGSDGWTAAEEHLEAANRRRAEQNPEYRGVVNPDDYSGRNARMAAGAYAMYDDRRREKMLAAEQDRLQRPPPQGSRMQEGPMY